MKRLQRLTLCSLLALPLVALAQPAPPEAANSPPVVSAMDEVLFYQLLLAEINQNQGDLAEAYALYMDAANKTKDARLYQRALEMAQRAREGSAILQAARAWKAAEPQSMEANRQLFQTLLSLNQIGETLTPLRDELARQSGEARALFITQIPRLYARVSDKSAATRVVETALANELSNPQNAATAWSTVGRMRLNANNLAGAQEAAWLALKHKTVPDTVAVLALELMAKNMEPGEALLLKALDSSTDPELRMAYVRVLLQAERFTNAAQQLQLLLQKNPEHQAAWMIQASLQMQERQYPQAEQSLQRYLALSAERQKSTGEAGRGVPQAYMYLSDIAVQRKDWAGALAWLDRVDPAAKLRGVPTRRASILAQQGQLEQAREVIRSMAEQEPGDARAKLLAEAQLLRDAKQYRPAYDLLSLASRASPPDADLLYEQALMAEKLGDLNDMERLLRAAISAKPDSPAAYNALGYSLAERNLRLPEAKQLIQKALVYAPADPAITDSLGWVEFRLGNHAEAKRVLERAYQARPDADIASHLGEVLWSMGQRDRAVDLWKQAQKLNPDSETLQDTLKRLQVKW